MRIRRSGYTMLEMIMSLAAATALLAGMGSSIFIANQVFDGKSASVARSKAADVQADMLNDLRHATSFTARSSTAATFSVPDRDGDGKGETISYSWAGAPDYRLRYSLNNGNPITLLDDVRDFRLNFYTRSLVGASYNPPTMNFNAWGDRWRTSGTFGYTTHFLLTTQQANQLLATRVPLSEAGKVKSISAYFQFGLFGGSTKARAAVYAVDGTGLPSTRLVQSSVLTISSSGWTTFDLAPTSLAAGNYYLALSYDSSQASLPFNLLGGNSVFATGNATLSNGFPATWSGGSSNGVQISIYATYDIE
jgi:hypothetical protein